MTRWRSFVTISSIGGYVRHNWDMHNVLYSMDMKSWGSWKELIWQLWIFEDGGILSPCEYSLYLFLFLFPLFLLFCLLLIDVITLLIFPFYMPFLLHSVTLTQSVSPYHHHHSSDSSSSFSISLRTVLLKICGLPLPSGEFLGRAVLLSFLGLLFLAWLMFICMYIFWCLSMINNKVCT